MRLQLKRGVTNPNQDRDDEIRIRVNRDNRRWSRWKSKKLGRFGDRSLEIEFGSMGSADTWQFEIETTDHTTVEIRKMQVLVERLGW